MNPEDGQRIETAIATQGRERRHRALVEFPEFRIEDEEKFLRAMNGVRLNPNEARVRIGNSGRIYYRSYRDVVLPADGAGELEPEAPVALGTPVTFIRWNESDTLEEAMLSIGIVEAEYDDETGEQVQKFMDLWDKAEDLCFRYERGEIKKDEFNKEAQDMERVLVETGFDNTVKPIRRQIANRLRKAVRPDIKDRINSSMGRLVASYAIEDIKSELVFATLVRDKYKFLGFQLSQEREKTRSDVQQILDGINFVLSLNEGDAEYFHALRNLSREIDDKFSPLKPMAQPYREQAQLVRLYVNGPNVLDRYLFADFYGQNQADSLMQIRYVNQMKTHAERGVALDQCRHWLEEKALDEGDYILGRKKRPTLEETGEKAMAGLMPEA